MVTECDDRRFCADGRQGCAPQAGRAASERAALPVVAAAKGTGPRAARALWPCAGSGP